MHMKRARWILAAVMVLLLASDRGNAATIGTFSTGRTNIHSSFNLFTGNLMDDAVSALTGDGHGFVNLDAGISAGSLAGIDTVYLPLVNSGSPSILSAAESSAVASFVNSGGSLIIQGDVLSFSTAYNNVAGEFGVQYTSGIGFGFGVQSLTGSFAALTSGPHGTVSSIQTASTGYIDPGASSGVSLLDSPALDGGSLLYVLGPGTGFAGAGHVVFLADVNPFDDPENANGLATADGLALWRNMFELQGAALAVPEPSSLLLLGIGGLGLISYRRRKRRG